MIVKYDKAQNNTHWILLILLFPFFLLSCKKEEVIFKNYETIEIRQEFSNDWSRWIVESDSINGTFKTEFSNSWDRWLTELDNDNGIIKTEFSNDWDRWKFNINGNSITIKTEFNESWNRWIISGNSLEENIFVKTEFSDENTRWIISTAEKGQVAQLKTIFSNDYGRWELRLEVDEKQFTSEELTATLFIGVFTSSIYEQEVIE